MNVGYLSIIAVGHLKTTTTNTPNTLTHLWWELWTRCSGGRKAGNNDSRFQELASAPRPSSPSPPSPSCYSCSLSPSLSLHTDFWSTPPHYVRSNLGLHIWLGVEGVPCWTHTPQSQLTWVNASERAKTTGLRYTLGTDTTGFPHFGIFTADHPLLSFFFPHLAKTNAQALPPPQNKPTSRLHLPHLCANSPGTAHEGSTLTLKGTSSRPDKHLLSLLWEDTMRWSHSRQRVSGDRHRWFATHMSSTDFIYIYIYIY